MERNPQFKMEPTLSDAAANALELMTNDKDHPVLHEIATRRGRDLKTLSQLLGLPMDDVLEIEIAIVQYAREMAYAEKQDS